MERDRVVAWFPMRANMVIYVQPTCLAELLRPVHLECAVIVFGIVGGKEIGGVHLTSVFVDAARQFAQICFACKREHFIGIGSSECSGVTEAQNLVILRVKTSFVGVVGKRRQQAPQFVLVPTGGTGPGSFPSSGDADGWNLAGFAPLAMEARATGGA